MVAVVAPMAVPIFPRTFSYLAPTTISSVSFDIELASVFSKTAATPPSA